MTQPQQPEKNITADDGFARWKQIQTKWIPERMYHTGRLRRGLRSLKGHR